MVNAEDKLNIEALFVITASHFVLGFWIRRNERAVRAWPQSTGKIVTSKSFRQAVGQGREEVTPIIEYEFDYQGRLFKTSHWRFGNFSVGNSLSAEAVTSRYPVGSIVTVFVNPRQPEKSALEAGTSSLCWVPFGFGFFFLAITSFVTWEMTHG
jgi:hypothetical protein